jgi:signal transduction histidine kinase
LQDQVRASGSQPTALADYTGVLEQSQRLFALGQELSTEHYKRRNLFLMKARQAAANMRRLQLGSLGLLFVFVVALAGVVYRDMISPLRLKVVESQSLLERNEKLASLGTLAAGVAHEIRNPLTAIKAALFIQQKKFPRDSQEYADAQLIEREILRLERIVNNFLQFARPAPPELTMVEPDTLLRETQQFLAPALARSHIRLDWEPSEPLRIRVDAAQIKQVLINLVQNAADSIGQNGTVKLHARRDRKRLANQETDVVIIEVADTGKGIPPEIQKRLFDPFFTTKDAGTGLGLSIAAGIVQKHGGVLQYQTQVHHGTTFGIVLPQAIA